MIVIPMAGLSRRFTDAGYDKPKYMLPLPGGSVFSHAVGSFAAYFDTTEFLFIARDLAGTPQFVGEQCRSMGLRQFSVQVLQAPTAGQAETVELGLLQAAIPGNDPITIFNIDTFRPGFAYPAAEWYQRTDGYLEVFRGTGANWSYVKPGHADGSVAETAEKRPISDLCCTGLYHFSSARDFLWSLGAERANRSSAELYVAPLYNHLIGAGRHIHYEIIDTQNVVFCGVPAEYEALLAARKPE